jgi:hypothetical protein
VLRGCVFGSLLQFIMAAGSASSSARMISCTVFRVGCSGLPCGMWRKELPGLPVGFETAALDAWRANLQNRTGGGSRPEARSRSEDEGDWNRPRLQKRGALAWLRHHNPFQLSAGLPNDLIVHAGTDETALVQYVPSVRSFLTFCIDYEFQVRWIFQRDLALADYLSYQCCELDLGVESGRTALNAVCYIFTEMRGRIPFSQRAMQAWSKLYVSGEGMPTSWAGLAAISRSMHEAGDVVEAEVIMVSGDCYLRGSDWASIRDDDVSGVSHETCSVSLGVPERGESSKTGIRQGVRPDRPGISEILMRRRDAAPKGAKIFPTTRGRVSRAWNRASVRLGHDCGPLHVARHTAPSEDARGTARHGPYRSLDQIRVRGRWRAKTSVLRYAKTHMLLRAEAQVPLRIREYGDEWLARFGERAEKAIQ